ncbi:MAG: class I SAM-dependent methyltransferase, partial [Chitinophagales bacterium]
TNFYEIADESDWMARYFFKGGMMPGDNLVYSFSNILTTQSHWVWSGLHYAKTAKAWLENMDRNKEEISIILKETYGNAYQQWWNYWRIFFMACEELWRYNNGNEWLVSHYLLSKNA